MNSIAKDFSTYRHQEEEDLFEENLSLVKTIAYQIAVRLPHGKSIEDLMQVGMLGLLEAARIYDPTLGASFKSYASIRIRGAIIDELRRQSWVPRSVQKKSKQLSEAIRRVENRLGRSATDREIARELNESMEEYSQTLEDVAGASLFSLDDMEYETEGENDNSSPFENLQDEALKKELARQISKLPDQEKLVIALYYHQELNLREIGEVLEVSESRVCQIHSQAVSRLKSRMKSWTQSE